MSSLIVEVSRIEEILPIENADRLEIARVKGWYVIVGKNEHKVNDLVIYLPVDSVLPEELIKRYNITYLKNKNRIRPLKLRGVVSQGLILKIPQDRPEWHVEGLDLAQELNITKWTAPENPISRKGQKRPLSLKRRNENFYRYTGIENVRNFNTIFTEEDEVVITEKVHGANCRVANLRRNEGNNIFEKYWNKFLNAIFGNYETIYGSHNVQLRWGQYRGVKEGYYEENVYEKVLKKYKLNKICPKDYTIYGECYGNGVQDLTYGRNDVDFIAFDVTYKNKYLNYVEFKNFCKQYGIPTVPQLYIGKYSDEVLKQYTKGDSILASLHGKKQIREGVVVKPLVETNHPKIGRKILKSISEDYLTRAGNQTEYQ
jgi:RNA ligase (TIGR02306 family)